MAFPEPRQLSALKREYQILEMVDGKGIPKAIDFMEQKNSVVIIREWVDGLSLRDYEQSTNISIDVALEISIEVARLIGAVHGKNYCYRDLSAGNILVDPETHHVTLIDFCSALEFPNRARNIVKPKFIEGSRPYMSPEQTGRMNRGLDFRTDFYSLGVLFYELFAGQLPFTTKDTNELIHSHIALDPTPPTSVKPSLPQMISKIIMKLMSKSPDARYQSAQGVQADLEHCLAQWKSNNKIDDFELAINDLHDWFIIPEKVYGREEETIILKHAFDQAAKSHGHLVFVSGHSGVGKTALVKELHRTIISQGGYLASGKYDQLRRQQPYSAILQILNSLIRQIMSESQSKITFWREKILEGIGANGQLFFDAIPELKLLIGEQPQIQELSMEAASTRFNTTFYNLIYALGHAGQPLVIFIDDLQWIDASSLSLLEAIAPAIADSYLLMIGAYRSNEVSDSHPLIISMPEIRQNCQNTLNIELKELPRTILIDMLDDIIDIPKEETECLSHLLIKKTRGNPLIFKTLLATLYNQDSIYFDYQQKKWCWDQGAIEDIPQPETVIEMLQSDMVNLPQQTVELLKLAGCIDNCFGLDLLTSLSELSRFEVANALIPVVSKGYIQPQDDDFELLSTQEGEKLPDINFCFVHDRIQQAAYSMNSKPELEDVHWAIGQQLLKRMQNAPSDAILFDAVEHLNQGNRHADAQQQIKLIENNLVASKKAKQSAAFSVAYSCLTYAHDLLLRSSTNADSELSINVDIELAQACYLVGEFEQAEALYQDLTNRVKSDSNKLKLVNIQAKQYHHQGLYQKSLQHEYEALRLLGVDLPTEDEALLAVFSQEKEAIESLLKEKDDECLYHQDEVSDANFILTHELLFDTFVDAYLLGKSALVATVAAIGARLSVQQGNCAVTSASYINYATVLCSSGEYKEGHKIGRLAVRLADKYQNPAVKNYTYHVFALGINHWLEPLDSSYKYWHQASKLSMESGSPYAGWVFLQLPHLLLASNAHLDQVEAQVKESTTYLSENRLNDMVKLLKMIVQQPLRHLKGETNSFNTLDDADFSTAAIFEEYKEAPFFLGHIMYSVLRTTLLCRDIQPAEKVLEWLSTIESTVQAQIIQVDSCLYTALHLTAGCTALQGDERSKQLESIQQIMAKVEVWAELCPENFKHKYLLLKAEWLRLHDNTLGAFDHYDLAREAALNSRFLMDAALTDELAGLFWLDVGKAYQSTNYLKRAAAGYEQWGAKGKVAWMKERFAELNVDKDIDQSDVHTSTDSTLETEDFSAVLDLGSVVKVSQAVSQHIHIDKLAEELLNLAVENAGATRGLLLLENEGEFLVTQEVNSKSETANESIPYMKFSELSHPIVSYVINSGRSVVYTPKDHDEQFDRCAYLSEHKRISVLCVPIVHHKKLSGVLYLENTHVDDAFHSDRVKTLKIIASQAAISFANAKMYHDLQLMNKNLEDLVKERTSKLYEANEQLTEKNSELYILSTRDQLTKLYNRRYVEEQLQSAFKKREESDAPFSILMLDIDHFKSINDAYGHHVGDKVLANIASSIQHSVRSGDIAGRWGGEEFIVLCLSSIKDAASIANKLGEAISSEDYSPVESLVTASIGVTQCLVKTP